MVESIGSSGGFPKDAARFVVGAASIEHVAALHGMKPEQALAALSDPGMEARVARAVAELERDGSAGRMQARALLHESIRRLSDMIDQGECSPSFLLRLAEVTGKLSAEPKDERKEASGPTFAINIDLGGGNSVTLKSDPLTLDAATGELVEGKRSPGWQA